MCSDVTRENIVAYELCFLWPSLMHTCCVSIEVSTFLLLLFAASVSSTESV